MTFDLQILRLWGVSDIQAENNYILLKNTDFIIK